MFDELNDPIFARFYINGNIVYRNQAESFFFTPAIKAAFIYNVAEERDSMSRANIEPFHSAIERLLQIQQEVDAVTSALRVVAVESFADESTVLLVNPVNVNCVVEIAQSDLFSIDLKQLAEDMEDESQPRGLVRPFVVAVDSPFYAFI